jgi:hypothetical protein
MFDSGCGLRMARVLQEVELVVRIEEVVVKVIMVNVGGGRSILISSRPSSYTRL